MKIGNLDIIQIEEDYNSKFFIQNNDNILCSVLLYTIDLPVENYHFFAEDICSLSDYIKKNTFTIDMAYRLVYDMYKQIKRMESKYNFTIPFIDLDDIMVFNENRFYFVNYDKLLTLEKKFTGTIYTSYDKSNIFLSPEFKNNEVLPLKFYASSVYYSLALVILHLLSNEKLLYDIDSSNSCVKASSSSDNDYSNTQLFLIKNYNFTKLQYILLRCLYNNPTDRAFIIF